MYKTSKATLERKDAKRQFILNTAAKVFAKRGYHNTSVKDIVEEASVSVGSFYFYFKSKEELFIELYRSIAKEFQNSTDKVLYPDQFSLAKNFTRAMISNLWMYEKNCDIAKLMLKYSGINPEFERIRSESIKESCEIMEIWFKRFKTRNPVNIPDERVASIIFQGTYYYLINDWLESDQSVRLTDSGYALCIYNLQALRIPFDEDEVKKDIKEVLEELSQNTMEESCFE